VCKASVLRLSVKLADGSTHNISSSSTGGWMATTTANPIRYSHLFHGEIYDAVSVATGKLSPVLCWLIWWLRWCSAWRRRAGTSPALSPPLDGKRRWHMLVSLSIIVCRKSARDGPLSLCLGRACDMIEMPHLPALSSHGLLLRPSNAQGAAQVRASSSGS
jgi:hypothetical protein